MAALIYSSSQVTHQVLLRTVDFTCLADTLVTVGYADSLTVRIGIFRSHVTPLTGGGSASLNPRDAVFALSVAAKQFVLAGLFMCRFADSDTPGRILMRRTATICAALAAFALSGAQAQAGFLFFGNSCAPKASCCNSAPKCCNGGLFSNFKLPKLSLPRLGGNKCCNPAPSCCNPAPTSCSGGHAPAAELSPSAGGSKVEDAPAPPPYEEKAPAPAAPAADAAPAPAKEAAPAAPAKEAAAAPAAPKA